MQAMAVNIAFCVASMFLGLHKGGNNHEKHATNQIRFPDSIYI